MLLQHYCITAHLKYHQHLRTGADLVHQVHISTQLGAITSKQDWGMHLATDLIIPLTPPPPLEYFEFDFD